MKIHHLMLLSLVFLVACKKSGGGSSDLIERHTLILPNSSTSSSSSSSGGEHQLNSVVYQKTSPPRFLKVPQDQSASQYRISFWRDDGGPIKLADLRFKGRMEETPGVNISVTSSRPELFDGDKSTTINEEGHLKTDPLVVEFQTNEAALLESFHLHLSQNETIHPQGIKLEYLKQGEWEEVYSAVNLNNLHYSIWTASEATRFNLETIKELCSEGQMEDPMGECLPAVVLCSDLADTLNTPEAFGCPVKRDGKEINCFNVTSKAECSAKSANLCQDHQSLIEFPDQLFEIFFEDGERQGTAICSPASN